MKIVSVTICLTGLGLLAACSEEPPPVSTEKLMANPRLLEATVVRCGQNRAEMKYVADCMNARDAVNRLERAEERERRAALEQQSERKRQALRQTQEAAAAARRRAEEERRRREEAAYLGLFEETPAANVAEESDRNGALNSEPVPAGNAPTADFESAPEPEEELPVAEELPAEPGSDLEAIREELKRRQQSPNN